MAVSTFKMPLGPYDRRKKRSRCIACSVSHLKCSNTLPCQNCSRRDIECSFAPLEAKQQLIVVDRSDKAPTFINTTSVSSQKKKSSQNGRLRTSKPKQKTMLVARPEAKVIDDAETTENSSVIPYALTDEKQHYLHFFNIFALRNKFTISKLTFGDEVQKLSSLHSHPCLMNAMVSLGALQLQRVSAPGGKEQAAARYDALTYYTESIKGLRDELASAMIPSAESRHAVLWATLFLGLFELMNDATGDGWRQHIIHGTTKALEASGPAVCRIGFDQCFFQQARVFEVCRSMLFTEETFLHRPEWLEVSADNRLGRDVEQGSAFDTLLDLMVACSSLRVRARKMIYGGDTSDGEAADPASIATEGFILRQKLEAWNDTYALHDCSINPDILELQPLTPAAASMGGFEDIVLSRMFFAATSIYLSGIFDYEIAYWNSVDIGVSTLTEVDVQANLSCILSLISVALNRTNLSPLLFLVPLRIAGARSRKKEQRDVIKDLLACVNRQFAVADAISSELDKVWTTSPLHVSSSALDQEVN